MDGSAIRMHKLSMSKAISRESDFFIPSFSILYNLLTCKFYRFNFCNALLNSVPFFFSHSYYLPQFQVLIPSLHLVYPPVMFPYFTLVDSCLTDNSSWNTDITFSFISETFNVFLLSDESNRKSNIQNLPGCYQSKYGKFNFYVFLIAL